MQSQMTIAVTRLIQSIGDARSITLVEESVVNSGSNEAAHNRGQNRNNEIIMVRGKNFPTIDKGREEPGTEVSSRIDGLAEE